MDSAHEECMLDELKEAVDYADFATVKQCFNDPSIEITQVVIVQKGWDLCEVAVKMVSPGDNPREKFFKLLESGAVKVATPDLRDSYPPPLSRNYVILFEDIDSKQGCHVLYLPPAYLVKFEGD